MKKRHYFALALLIIISIAFYQLRQDYERTPPTIYTNTTILTINENGHIAEAMYVKDGIIEAIGSTAEIAQFETDGVEVVDLKGATILPGFIDAHTHFALSMFLAEMHDLSGFTHQSNAEIWEYFEEVVARTPKGEWILCKGIDPVLVQDLVPPHISYLDKVAPDNPVLILSQSLHNYWANSLAFDLVGITSDTPDPSAYSFYEKDESGRLTGQIVEQAAFDPFATTLTEKVLTAKVLSAASEAVLAAYAKNGNTTIVSTGLSIKDSKPLLLLNHLSNDKPTALGNFLAFLGILPERQASLRHFIYMRHDRAELMPEKKGDRNDFYDIIGIKHWYDGSPYIGSMYLEEPYLDTELSTDIMHIPAGSKGEALIHADSLRNFIKSYHAKGWQIAIHTQGDAATREVIDAFEAVNETDQITSGRHRLEHCLLIQSTELERLKALNMTPSFHINHLYYYGDALKHDMLGEERVEQILPLGETHQKQIPFSLHADQPMFESHPFRLIQTAIERKTINGDTIGMNQKISLTTAIQSMTIHAAWQINMEDKLGSLEKGKYADFIILDRNPYEVQARELEQIKCLSTFVHGNKVY